MNDKFSKKWEKKKFGDIAKVINGYAFNDSDLTKLNSKFPLVRMNNLKSGYLNLSNALYVKKEIAKDLEKFQLHIGDFIFGMSGSLSNYAWIRQVDGVCYQNQRVGRLKNINSNQKFISYLFNSDQIQSKILIYAAGAAQLNISSKQIEDLDVLVPPTIEEQKKIASILTSVDNLIEKIQSHINKLKDLKNSVMNDLLTKGIGHKNFQDSEIGKLPNNWELKKVSDIADVIDPHPSHRAPSIDLNGIPFIGIGDIEENGNILLSKVRKVSAEIFHEHNKRYEISKKTIGFGRVASIGKIIDFINYSKKILISPTIAIIEPKKIIKTYLINILKSNLMKKQIDYLTTGSTRSSLGIMLIRNLLLPVAPIVEQRKISLVFDSIDEVIKKNVQKIRKINFLKKSLMQDLMTGKVRVQMN